MLRFRKAAAADIKLYFDWVNDSAVREQSYHSNAINFANHSSWFESKLNDPSCLMLVFQNDEKLNVGQIRIQKENEKEAVIAISISLEHRGKGYAKEMLKIALDYFFVTNENILIHAFIKENNPGSKHAFEKAGFQFEQIINYENCKSFHYIKSNSI